MHAKLLKSHHSHHNTKAAVACDNLTCTIDGLRHVEQKVDRLRVPHPLVLARKGPSPIGRICAILSLDDLYPPHDQLPAITVCDQMIFIAKWMQFAREGHKTGAELVQPRVHGLVDARKPRWHAPLGVMVIEGINHLMHLVKAIEEEQGCFLVGIPECVHYLVEATP